MKRHKRLPIPQHEFGFTPEAFNLIQEISMDGARLSRERADLATAHHHATRAQTEILMLIPQVT